MDRLKFREMLYDNISGICGQNRASVLPYTHCDAGSITDISKKCEYCGRNNSSAEEVCKSCGAPTI